MNLGFGTQFHTHATCEQPAVRPTHPRRGSCLHRLCFVMVQREGADSDDEILEGAEEGEEEEEEEEEGEEDDA